MPNGGIADTWLFPQYSLFIQAFLPMPKKNPIKSGREALPFLLQIHHLPCLGIHQLSSPLS
jgi:hypothetical protein